MLPGLDFYLSAFFDLFADRPNGEPGARIPWTAREAYAVACGLPDWQKNRFHNLISELDSAYLKDYADKEKKKRDKEEARQRIENRRVSRKRA